MMAAPKLSRLIGIGAIMVGLGIGFGGIATAADVHVSKVVNAKPTKTLTKTPTKTPLAPTATPYVTSAS